MPWEDWLTNQLLKWDAYFLNPLSIELLDASISMGNLSPTLMIFGIIAFPLVNCVFEWNFSSKPGKMTRSEFAYWIQNFHDRVEWSPRFRYWFWVSACALGAHQGLCHPEKINPLLGYEALDRGSILEMPLTNLDPYEISLPVDKTNSGECSRLIPPWRPSRSSN